MSSSMAAAVGSATPPSALRVEASAASRSLASATRVSIFFKSPITRALVCANGPSFNLRCEAVSENLAQKNQIDLKGSGVSALELLKTSAADSEFSIA
ncbi:hypothetical protein L6164_036435 [Bauhinia variegata]|uniref:Uncharacterized protein n=1 Tax=Bauhinia variegata TaxID=167791 RepID=A0ACB9KH52_BAUVA|nr:hypothetical protein L6164_036435 [Bauhinia variegata]